MTSVAWAPSCGRSYHLIATGSRDGHVRIWRVKPPTLVDDFDQEGEVEEGSWSAYVFQYSGVNLRCSLRYRTIVGDFDDHKSPVGRVEWNITGYEYLHLSLPRANTDTSIAQSCHPPVTTGACGFGRPQQAMCGVQQVTSAWSRQKSNKETSKWMIIQLQNRAPISAAVLSDCSAH